MHTIHLINRQPYFLSSTPPALAPISVTHLCKSVFLIWRDAEVVIINDADAWMQGKNLSPCAYTLRTHTHTLDVKDFVQ